VHRVESGDGGCPQEDEIGDLKMTTARVLWSRSDLPYSVLFSGLQPISKSGGLGW